MGAEENQCELRGVCGGGDGSVLSTLPHEYNTLNSPAIYQGDRHRCRRTGDIQGVFSTGNEVGVMPDKWMPGKGKQPREAQRKLHVSSLEVEGGNYIESNGTAM